jgi:sn-glycerol 3-phosphate transport system permease protein
MKLNRIRPYLMVFPAITLFSVFSIYPIIYMIYLSFFKWNMMGSKKFLGLKNYADLVASREFGQIIGNSLYFVALSVGLSLVLSLLAALFLRKSTVFNRFLQASILRLILYLWFPYPLSGSGSWTLIMGSSTMA